MSNFLKVNINSFWLNHKWEYHHQHIFAFPHVSKLYFLLIRKRERKYRWVYKSMSTLHIQNQWILNKMFLNVKINIFKRRMFHRLATFQSHIMTHLSFLSSNVSSNRPSFYFLWWPTRLFICIHAHLNIFFILISGFF